jgi:hypothetical protein
MIISRALDLIIEQYKENHKVILLFDESQHLLKNEVFAFRCVCRWLQYNRDQRVVAVMLAQTLGLLISSPAYPNHSRHEILLTFITKLGNPCTDRFGTFVRLVCFLKRPILPVMLH